MNNFDLENAEIVGADQENGEGYVATAAKIQGKDNQGQDYNAEYLNIESTTPGNMSDIEYLNLEGKDATGEPFDAEVAVINAQNAQGKASLTAVNVTGDYQGKPFDVTYAQLNGTTDGEDLNIEVAEIEGFNDNGEQFDLTVTSVQYTTKDGEQEDSESVSVVWIPSGRKPTPNSGSPMSNLENLENDLQIPNSGNPQPNSGRPSSGRPSSGRPSSGRASSGNAPVAAGRPGFGGSAGPVEERLVSAKKL